MSIHWSVAGTRLVLNGMDGQTEDTTAPPSSCLLPSPPLQACLPSLCHLSLKLCTIPSASPSLPCAGGIKAKVGDGSRQLKRQGLWQEVKKRVEVEEMDKGISSTWLHTVMLSCGRLPNLIVFCLAYPFLCYGPTKLLMTERR